MRRSGLWALLKLKNVLGPAAPLQIQEDQESVCALLKDIQKWKWFYICAVLMKRAKLDPSATVGALV